MPSVSMLEGLSANLVDGLERALDGKSPLLPALDPPDAAGARAALAQLGPRATAVTQATDPDQWAAAVEQWVATLQDIADRAFGPPNAAEAMLARFLQERLPRTAAYLSLAGMIVSDPSGQDTIDWNRARAIFTDPGTAVDESLWDALLGDTGLSGSGRLPAVIVALLILAPQTIVALARGELTVNPLPAPAADGPGDWQTFRNRTEGWISITAPFGDPEAATPVPASLFDLASDLLPDLSATLGIRSQRRQAAGATVTDFELWLAFAAAKDKWEYHFGTGWFVRVEPGITIGVGHDGSWHGAFRQFPLGTVEPPGPGDPVVASLGRELPDGAPDLVLGPPYDTRIVIQDLGVYVKIREDHPIVEVGALVHGFALILTNRWFRTFGVTSELFGDGLRFDLDLDIAYVEGEGLQLNLSSGLEVTFDIDKQFGKDASVVNFKLHSIQLALPIIATEATFETDAEVRFHLSLKVGPVTMTVDGIGGAVGVHYDDGWSVPARFLPPTGAGLQIQAGPVTGGGFLDFTGGPNDRFGGLLFVKIGAFEVTAFGVHELTGHPDDAVRHTSIVLVLGVHYSPGLQLGYGFAISGVGGLVGINRRADTDALRERLTSGAAGNVLFSEDPVRNAPEILDDLDALFPPAAGRTVIGPTMELTWLDVAGSPFLRVDIGVFLDLPAPVTVVILGSARADVPPADGVPKLLHLRLDVVGLIDVATSTAEFDATLISSKALYTFHLTGDAAFRLHWGDQPYMFLTLGGFHPQYHPEPAVFPELTRLALTMEDPQLPGLFFRAEAYLAVTSNTVQFGAAIELGYKTGPLNIVGFVQLDALVQFSPFQFSVEFSAGIRLRWQEHTLAGVKFVGTITGPGPFVITGKACFEILWFDICKSATITIGSTETPSAPATSSATQALESELSAPSNLAGIAADDPHVAQTRRPGARPLVAPIGGLRWAQRRAPLSTLIDRFDGQPLPGPQRVVLTCPQALGPAADWFAPGSFATLTQAEELNRPAFEQLPAGADLTFPVAAASPVLHDVAVQEIRLPAPAPKPGRVLAFPFTLLEAARDRTAPGVVRTRQALVGVRNEVFVVRDTAGAVTGTATSAADAFGAAQLDGGVAVAAGDLVDATALGVPA